MALVTVSDNDLYISLVMVKYLFTWQIDFEVNYVLKLITSYRHIFRPHTLYFASSDDRNNLQFVKSKRYMKRQSIRAHYPRLF